MIRYEIMVHSYDDEDELSDYDYDESDEEGSATVVRVNEDGTKTEIGWIGGEPEDNTYYRTYSWVVDALNDAHKIGFRMGRIQADEGFVAGEIQ